jgi:hypothetical protein
MGMEITGRLHTIFETKQVSERFSKREFVVELADNPKYPQTVLFQLTGDRCAQLDGMNVNDQITIEFSLRGREWRSPSGEVKYFNSLDVWRVEPARAGRGQSRGNDRDDGPRYSRGSGAPPRDNIPPATDYDQRPSDFGGSSRDEDIPF